MSHARQNEVTRYTFVVHIYPGGQPVLENLSTRDRIRLSGLADVASEIERWLVTLTASEEPGRSAAAAGSKRGS